MAKIIQEIKKGVIEVLRTPEGWAWLLAGGLAIFWLLVLIPVWTIPGNDVRFQLSLLTPALWFIMVGLSLGNGLLLAMQARIRKQRKAVSAKELRKGAITVGSLGATIFSSTIACAACYSALFSFLGLGTAAVLVRNRFWIAGLAFLITVFAIYNSSKALNGHCEECRIK